MGQLSNLRRSIAVCELLSFTAWFISSENGVPLIFASIGLAGGGSFSSIDRALAAARSSSLSSSPMWSHLRSAKSAIAAGSSSSLDAGEASLLSPALRLCTVLGLCGTIDAR